MGLTGFTLITAGQTNADSPINQILMDSLRTDINHLREFGYGDGTAAQVFLTPIDGHNHDGTNSRLVAILADSLVTNSNLADYTAGTVPILLSTISVTNNQITFIDVTKAVIDRNGTLTIGFNLKIDNATYTAIAQLYLDGIAIGAQQSTQSTTDVDMTQTIIGLTANSTLTLKVRSSNVGLTATASGLYLKCGTATNVIEVPV